MDLKLFFATFITIFLAELGDKTQLATIALGVKEKSPFTIFGAAVLAFAASTVVALVIGTFLTKFIPEYIIEKIAAGAFIVIGFLMLFNKL